MKKLLGTVAVAVFLFGSYAVYDWRRSGSPEGVGVDMHRQDRCFRSAALETGPTNRPWYSTVSPCEAYESQRTHTFPHTCNVEELTGAPTANVRMRTLSGLPGLYNIVTRERDELFVLGGINSSDDCRVDGAECATGPYVAKIDAHTMQVVWKRPFHNAKENRDWDYPGAIGVHGNGFVYAVNGYHMVKIDPGSGEILVKRKMPVAQDRAPGDTVYNGFSILSDGHLIAKSMTREKGATADAIKALLFHSDASVPSTIAVVEPGDLRIVAAVQVREPVLGRITNGVFRGKEYVYVGGYQNLFRYVYENGAIALDETWGPVPYCFEGQKPGTAPAFFGDFVLIQTNFQLAPGALSLTAAAHADSTRVFHFTPFADDRILPGSLQWSLPTVDVENSRIYAGDALENKLAAIDFDGEKGFSIAWKVNQRSLSFGAVMGPKAHRVFVLDDANLPTLGSVNVIWRNAQTGEILAESGALPTGGGLPVTPGFDGVIYYLSHSGKLTELTLTAGTQ
jgi:hypothetical protein